MSPISQSLRPFLTCIGLTGAALTALVVLNPTHFTSVDSGCYLQSAANLLAGRGYVMENNGQWFWNSTFPIGYSALIAVLSNITGLPVLWASKLINVSTLILSAGLWLRRIGPGRAIWLLSVWWTGGFLRILAYTWSETLFLVLLAEWVWGLNGFLKTTTLRWSVRLALLSFGLFLVRYIGGYTIGFMMLLAAAIYLIPIRVQSLLRIDVQPGTAHALLGTSGICLVGTGAYGWLNYQLSGSLYGGDRFLPTGSASSLMTLFAQSIGNELLLIRDFLPAHSNQLAWVGAAIQLVWLWLVRRQFLQQPSPIGPHWRFNASPTTTLVRLFVLVGGLYVFVLFGLRVVSPFSGPTARLMAPATFCILTAGLLWVGTTDAAWQRKLRPYWIGLLICSWLQLLPQVDLSAKMAQVQALISATYK